jgi:hypothetical protein
MNIIATAKIIATRTSRWRAGDCGDVVLEVGNAGPPGERGGSCTSHDPSRAAAAQQ